MRNYEINRSVVSLPQLGILTHVEELTRYDMIYVHQRLERGVSLRIEQDEERTWDDQSLAVFYKGFKLGYISKKTSGMVQKFLKQGNQVYATVKSLSKKRHAPVSELDIQIHVH